MSALSPCGKFKVDFVETTVNREKHLPVLRHEGRNILIADRDIEFRIELSSDIDDSFGNALFIDGQRIP